MEVQDFIDLKLVHEIHTSERRSFRACRRRWDWLFNQSYYPKTTAKPLEFGSCYHRGMEVLYAPATWDWDREVIAAKAILAFVEMCEAQRKAALELNGQTYLDTEIQEDYDERVELGKGMLRYYASEVAPKLDKGWTPVKVEIAFMIPVPNPETGEEVIWCKCDNCWDKYKNAYDEKRINVRLAKDQWQGLPVVYAGRLDMLAEDENGHYWIFDWKTARNITEKYDFLYLDDQVSSYVWALTRLGISVKGFVYHEQRKGFPQPPKKNKTRRLGCIFSVAKNQDVDYDTYLETIKAEDTEAYESGFYDEMLLYLENEGVVYYMRHQIAKSHNEIDEVERNIGLEALDMIDPKLRIYPSPGRFGCNFCAFQTPCMEANNKGDYQYALDTMFEQREHYYVRNEPSTESKGGE